MAQKDNKGIVERYLKAWEQGNTETLSQLLAINAVTHISATTTRTSQDFEPQACADWVAAFPDTKLVVDQLIAEKDTVAAYWTITATHQNSFMGMAATGKRVHFGGLEINRIAEGKIIEIWRLSDTLTLMQQLGTTE